MKREKIKKVKVKIVKIPQFVANFIEESASKYRDFNSRESKAHFINLVSVELNNFILTKENRIFTFTDELREYLCLDYADFIDAVLFGYESLTEEEWKKEHDRRLEELIKGIVSFGASEMRV